MLKTTQTAKADHWLGFDLGGTKMLATVFNSEFRPVARKRKKTKGHNGVKSVVDRMVETVNEALTEFKSAAQARKENLESARA